MKWEAIDIAVALVPWRPERLSSAAELIAALARACPGASVRIESQVAGAPSTDRIERVFGRATREWLVHIEDDMQIGPDFGERLGDAMIENACVSLYCGKRRPDGLWADTFARCPVMLSSLARRIAELAPEWYEAHPEHHDAVDLAVAACARTAGARTVALYPSLVQHRSLPSTLGRRSTGRHSPTYREHYG